MKKLIIIFFTLLIPTFTFPGDTKISQKVAKLCTDLQQFLKKQKQMVMHQEALNLLLTVQGVKQLLDHAQFQKGLTGIIPIDELNQELGAYPFALNPTGKTLQLSLAFNQCKLPMDDIILAYKQYAGKYWDYTATAEYNNEDTELRSPEKLKALWVQLTSLGTRKFDQAKDIGNQKTGIKKLDTLNTYYDGSVTETYRIGNEGLVVLRVIFKSPVNSAVVDEYRELTEVALVEVDEL
jgi:hypothetical protein